MAASRSLRLGGSRQLLAFMIDDPPGVNAGLYEVLPLDPTRPETVHGLLPFLSGVLAVHTALLPSGKVLFFAGSGSGAVRFDSPLFGDEAGHLHQRGLGPARNHSPIPPPAHGERNTVRLLLRR